MEYRISTVVNGTRFYLTDQYLATDIRENAWIMKSETWAEITRDDANRDISWAAFKIRWHLIKEDTQ